MYNVYKAKSFTKHEKTVPDVTIVIEEEVPEYGTLDESDQQLQLDASHVFTGLKRSLPRGTLHRLLVLLLEES